MQNLFCWHTHPKVEWGMQWKTPRYVIVLGALLFAPGPAAAQAVYHHVHLIVPDAVEATQWYITHMGCGPVDGRDDAALCKSTKLYFFARESAGPSVGTGANSIGFAFDDLDAKVAALEAAGISLDEPGVRDMPNLFRSAFLTQWGTRIELVEREGFEGFHHLHLSSRNPEQTLSWYHEMFGGERKKLKGTLDAVLFRGASPPSGEVWLLASQARENLVRNEGRSIDHLGFSFTDLHSAAAGLKQKGTEFDVEPGEISVHHSGTPFGRGHLTLRNYSFVTGPDDVYIEIVECFEPSHCERPD